MKILTTLQALLLTLPLLAVTGCDNKPAAAGQNSQQQDNRLGSAVTEALQRDAVFARSDINVMVSAAGQVTLSGTVASSEDKRRAAEIVQQVAGIKNVNNELDVVSPANPD
ncbi:hypothetical protein WG68_11845 [Arsukibacterium ikkense]|uniref:BON domain-containing protein n=1 Tax=Arsukibacterium ikkense TaxID=336831 RepID=A0A0M2V3B4_9GAMM|nr:BON domain-containing protein [Arsukibacterium ikkense]KKO45121.1 hypothetical protein WG68_11845 [Arsukibacterium ikkense]